MINRQDTFENEWVLSGVQEARDLEEGGAQEREEGKPDKVVNENPKPLKLPSNLNGNLSMPELDERPLTPSKRKSVNLEQENREILYSKLIIHENQMHPRKGG